MTNYNRFKSFLTEKQSNAIKEFLLKRKEYLHLSNISKDLGRNQWFLAHFLKDKRSQKTLSQETIEKLCTLLAPFGLRPFSFGTLEGVHQLIANYYEVKPETMKIRTRKRSVVQKRQVAMYFSNKIIKKNTSFEKIGRYYGFDHSTVSFACKTVSNLADTDKGFKEEIEEIERLIKNN
jgi:chromosomal replication initiation ATPase DnaA